MAERAELRHLKPEIKGLLHSFHISLARYNTDIGQLYKSQVLDKLHERKYELSIHDGRILVATDGSLKIFSSLKSCAAAACVYTLADSRLNRVATLPVTNSVTILTAETVALLAAITVANQENFGRILVIADSKSVCDKFNTFQQGAYSIRIM